MNKNTENETGVHLRTDEGLVKGTEPSSLHELSGWEMSGAQLNTMPCSPILIKISSSSNKSIESMESMGQEIHMANPNFSRGDGVHTIFVIIFPISKIPSYHSIN